MSYLNSVRNIRIVYLVLASETRINQADLLMQKKTWARKDSGSSIIVWVRGQINGAQKFKDRELTVETPELTENILEKTKLAINWISLNFQPDFIVRTNVSTYFDIAEMEKFLEAHLDSSADFLGYPEYTGNKLRFIGPGFCFFSGTGLILSKRGYSALLEINSKEYEGIPDDVAMSHFLNRQGLISKKIHRSNLGYTHLFIPHRFIRLKSSESALLTQSRFVLVHEFYTYRGISKYIRVQLAEFRYINRGGRQFLDIARMILVCAKRWLQIEFGNIIK
jgi:hypothetical protein